MSSQQKYYCRADRNDGARLEVGGEGERQLQRVMARRVMAVVTRGRQGGCCTMPGDVATVGAEKSAVAGCCFVSVAASTHLCMSAQQQHLFAGPYVYMPLCADSKVLHLKVYCILVLQNS